MNKLLYAVLVGLVGAALVHIAILFLIPTFSERNFWTRLEGAGELYETVPLDDSFPGIAALDGSGDPLFREIACRFDLTDRPVRLFTPGRVPFWSISVRDRAGQSIYSFTDRAATDALLDVVVLTSTQASAFRNGTPEGLEGSIFITAPLGEGFAVVRIFRPDDSWNTLVESFLDELTCEPV